MPRRLGQLMTKRIPVAKAATSVEDQGVAEHAQERKGRKMGSEEGTGLRCGACGRPLDLRCEDCGCPVSCHKIAPGLQSDEWVLYCAWDGPCWKERSHRFLAAVEAWQREVARFTHRMTSPDQED
jgi:hypothetical protein